jgi:hypothetical protein
LIACVGKGKRLMKKPRKFGCAIAFGITAVVASTEASIAMPIGATSADSSHMRKIDWACGPGLHVTPWGRCVPNYWGGGYGYPAARGWYGPGWRRGWHGDHGEHREWEDHGGWRGGGGWRKHREWDD